MKILEISSLAILSMNFRQKVSLNRTNMPYLAPFETDSFAGSSVRENFDCSQLLKILLGFELPSVLSG